MSQLPPGPIPPVTPEPNRWKRSNPTWPYFLGVCIMAIGACVGCIILAVDSKPINPKHIDSPLPAIAQPHTIIEIHSSTGGSRHDTGKADPSSVDLSGNTIDAEGLKLDHTLINFDGLSIVGGGVAASFKVSGKTLALLQWLCVILAVPCLISGTVKWLAKDYIHAAGQGLCAVGLLLAAMDPDLMAWFGLAAVACVLISHWFPSLATSVASKAQAALADVVSRIRLANPTLAAQVEPDKHESAIAAAIKRETA